jgi:hypothetical protein
MDDERLAKTLQLEEEVLNLKRWKSEVGSSAEQQESLSVQAQVIVAGVSVNVKTFTEGAAFSIIQGNDLVFQASHFIPYIRAMRANVALAYPFSDNLEGTYIHSNLYSSGFHWFALTHQKGPATIFGFFLMVSCRLVAYGNNYGVLPIEESKNRAI